ncbi:hypothetical protein LCM28_09920 [Salipiger pacificus]|nr:hypothetical protein [Alloyangia pacifica]
MTRLRPSRQIRHVDDEEQRRREREALARIERELARRKEAKDGQTGNN